MLSFAGSERGAVGCVGSRHPVVVSVSSARCSSRQPAAVLFRRRTTVKGAPPRTRRGFLVWIMAFRDTPHGHRGLVDQRPRARGTRCASHLPARWRPGSPLTRREQHDGRGKCFAGVRAKRGSSPSQASSPARRARKERRGRLGARTKGKRAAGVGGSTSSHRFHSSVAERFRPQGGHRAKKGSWEKPGHGRRRVEVRYTAALHEPRSGEEGGGTKKIACVIVDKEGGLTERGRKFRTAGKPQAKREESQDRLARGRKAEEETGRSMGERVLGHKQMRAPLALSAAMRQG
ncbi:hypothetical protein ERJ75_001701100 [Trypanosoma vivax]|nr:hypothetical protein ERJ75_001701100 [Trypanosoma vivax]